MQTISKKLRVVKKVPATLTTEIGRIITRFSYIEHLLSRITYKLLGVNPREGRIAIREPRVIDRMEMIKDLLSLKGVKISGDIGKFLNIMSLIENERDRIAHGLWARDLNTGEISLRVTKGKWKLPGKVKRRIKPEAIIYDKIKLTHVVGHIDQAIKQIEQLDRMIEKALHTLKKKSELQRQTSNPLQARKNTKLRRLPKPSQV